MSRADKQIPREFILRLSSVVNAPENPVKYLSIDPGTYNGVCGYDAKYFMQFMYLVGADDIIILLNQFDCVETCVIESFSLFPDKAMKQVYSDMETPRVIGRVESWAETKGIKLVTQPSNIKKTGYAWIGKKPPSKSSGDNDPMDAHVHFMYWAVKNGKINAADLLKS